MNSIAVSCAFLLVMMAGQSALAARGADRLELGRMPTGAGVAFTRFHVGWGLAVGGSGGPELSQPEPARIQVSDGPGKVRELTAGYKTATRTGDALDATADLEDVSGVSFHVHDVWRLKGDVLSVQRTVSVHGTAPGALTLLSSSTFRGPRAGMM